MARIDALPSIDIIRGFQGILDFYVHRGTPCVRAWPKYRPARQTAPSKAAALLFGAIIKAFALTHGAVLAQLEIEATGIPRTPRDIYASGVYGNLHEASMSDFLTLLTQCRDFLSNLTALLNALDSLSLDELDVNVERSVLPSGASTLAEQQTQTNALERIDDLKTALQSVALDRLLVHGMDQLYSYQEPLHVLRNAAISGADGYIDSNSPGAGKVWIVTTLGARDRTTPINGVLSYLRADAVNSIWNHETTAFAVNQWQTTHVWKWLEQGDVARCYLDGSLVGDTCEVSFTGHVMTLET